MICHGLLRSLHRLMPCQQEIARLLDQKRRIEAIEMRGTRRTLATAKLARRRIERSGVMLSIDEIDEALSERWHPQSSKRS